jgi:hypothetical protein
MPKARSGAAEAVPGLSVVDNAMKAIVGADAIGLVTEWREFGLLPWAAIASAVERPIIVDGRNALDPEVLMAAGFEYIGFGRAGEVQAVAARAAASATDDVPKSEAVPARTASRRKIDPIQAKPSGA